MVVISTAQAHVVDDSTKPIRSIDSPLFFFCEIPLQALFHFPSHLQSPGSHQKVSYHGHRHYEDRPGR